MVSLAFQVFHNNNMLIHVKLEDVDSGMLEHTYNPSPQEAQAEGLHV
jgi:hypothetical protein